MKQVKENKEIADVAFEVVGDVADNAHAEMRKPSFKKSIMRHVTTVENFETLIDVLEFLKGLDDTLLMFKCEKHPVGGFVLTSVIAPTIGDK